MNKLQSFRAEGQGGLAFNHPLYSSMHISILLCVIFVFQYAANGNLYLFKKIFLIFVFALDNLIQK
jgi:hypothetical protein